MGLVRAVGICVAVCLVMMLTLNIKLRKESDGKDPFTQMLFRNRRAIGRKPPMVFGKCGGDHYGRYGWLATPNFPGSTYPAQSSCNWTISVYPRMVIRFDFVFMDMEDAPKQKRGGCQSDYLILREGPKEDDPLVGGQRYCGYDTPFNSVYSDSNRVYVYFASDKSTEGHGFAVRWTAVEPPRSQFNCDFESVNGLCIGWEQDTNDQFDWTTHNGKTQSGKTTATGPQNDHTKGTELGIYAYTEASGRRKGEKAVLLSPPIRVRNPNGQCFRFWYHMRGETMGTLNVYKKELISGQNTTAELIFTKTGEKGKSWRRADVNVTASPNRMKFMFEGVRGSSYRSDMAIDDISMLRNPCPARVVRTTTTATTTTKKPTKKPVRRPKPTKRTTKRPPTTTELFTTTTKSGCPGEHACKEVGNCIQLDYFCDGIPDCLHAEDEEGCAQKEAKTTTAPTAAWNSWSSYSDCTVTCGGGRSERTRTCNSVVQGSFFECPGSSIEGMECNTHKCLKWNEWEEWGACTTSCGGGIQTRGRTCSGGKSGQLGCIGPIVQIDYCNEHNCPKMGEWSQWSQCQATCGNGTISRSRTCEGGQIGDAGCDEKAKDVATCANPMAPACATWTDWDDFGECSVTCGGGTRTRRRKCQKGGATSKGCPGSESDSEECGSEACPVVEWGDWTPWSKCSLSCGGGFHGRRRACMLKGQTASGCQGRGLESGVCNDQACPIDPCLAKPCKNSGSCSTKKGPEGKLDYTCTCTPGYTGEDCTEVAPRICYAGVFVRSTVVPTNIKVMQPATCADPSDACMIATVATYVDGKAAYVHNAQCARKSLCKRLTCEDLKETMSSYDVLSCRIKCCDMDYCNAAPTDLPPPPTTTAKPTSSEPPKTRKPRPTRRPRKTTAPPTTVDTSKTHWSDWQSWQRCTHLCGSTGIRRRFRFCVRGSPGMPGCMPGNGMMGQEPCNRDVKCIRWEEWGAWESCSKSCDGGTAERRRLCDGGEPGSGECVGNDVDVKVCNEQPCVVTTSSTTTTTTKPQTIQPKKGWTQWSDWDTCSVSCGLGTQRRTKKCIGGRPGRRGCRGRPRQTQDCNNGECVTTTTTSTTTETTTISTTTTTGKPKKGWSLWSNWGSCSVSCGKGASTRSRECTGGRVGRRRCRGKRNEKKDCEVLCQEITTTAASTTSPSLEPECMKRNVRMARRNARRCPPECLSHSDCDEGTRCACDGLCGKTCQDTTKKCFDISAVSRVGTVVTCSNGASVGSKCTFSCVSGYALRGNANIFCQGTSKWTSQRKLPKCVASIVRTLAVTTSAVTTMTVATTTAAAPSCKFRYNNQDACCGTNPYNSSRNKCCDGRISRGGPLMKECCGNSPYNPRNKGCCGEILYSLSDDTCQNGAIVKQ